MRNSGNILEYSAKRLDAKYNKHWLFARTFFAKFSNLTIGNIKKFFPKFERAPLVAPTYPDCLNCGEVEVDHTLQQAGQVLLDSQGLAGRSGASKLAGGSGAPRHHGLAGGSGAATLAGGSGAPRQSCVNRQVRCCYTSRRVRCS
jgi:hypothetical protein